MSVMSKIRSGTDSGAMRAVLGIIVVVFVFWGIGSGNQATSQVVATVNGKRITDTRFHKVMRTVTRSQGRNMTEEEQAAMARRVIANLISEEVILQEADDLGIEISDEEIARYILDYDAFKDESARYSGELYLRHLKRLGTTRALFEEDLRHQLTLERLFNIAVASVAVADDEVRESWEAENTTLSLQVATVRAIGFYDDIEPTEIEIEAFVAENRPEIRAWYDSHYESRFHQPPRAQARMILLRSDIEGVDEETLSAKMAAIRQEVSAEGADFGMLARKYGEDHTAENGGNLGMVRFDQLNPALAEAIFGPEDGPLTSPGLRETVRTDRGLHLLLVEEMFPEETTLEEDARSEIALILMQERQAPGLAAAYAEELRASWAAAGSAPTDKLQAQGIIPAQVDSIKLAQPEVPGMETVVELGKALSDAQAGQVLDQVFESPGAWFVVQVQERDEPGEGAFEAASADYRPRVEAYKRAEFLEAWRDDLVARAKVEQAYRP